MNRYIHQFMVISAPSALVPRGAVKLWKDQMEGIGGVYGSEGRRGVQRQKLYSWLLRFCYGMEVVKAKQEEDNVVITVYFFIVMFCLSFW